MFLLCIQSECFKAQRAPIEDPYQVCNENSKRERRNGRSRGKKDVKFFYKYLRFLKSTTFFNPGIQERDISFPFCEKLRQKRKFQ